MRPKYFTDVIEGIYIKIRAKPKNYDKHYERNTWKTFGNVILFKQKTIRLGDLPFKVTTFSRPNTTFSPFLAPKIKTGSNQKIKACTNITRTQETLKITSR